MAPMSRVNPPGVTNNITSGSDAGTLPPLSDIFTMEETSANEPQLLDALSAKPKVELLADAVLEVIEEAITAREPPNLDTLVKRLAREVVVSLVESIPEAVRLYLEDVAPDDLSQFVEMYIKLACCKAAAEILPDDMTQIMVRHLPPMVTYSALQSEALNRFNATATTLALARRKNLSSLLELKTLRRASSASDGRLDFFNAHGRASLRTPEARRQWIVMRPSTTPLARGSVMTDAFTTARESRVSLRPNPGVVGQEQRRTASKDAEKAASAFKGGPFQGVADERGLAGFWRRVESVALRRGWESGGPEHYFLLTNLVDEYILEEATNGRNPVTMLEFSQAVDAIHDCLSEECGGHFQAEMLLAEPTARADDENCKEASYEYPGTWSRFRSKALTRAARVVADRSTSSSEARAQRSSGVVPDKPAVVSQRPTSKTELCRNALRGRCLRGDRCQFRHIAATECRQWAADGRCRFGRDCKFSHDRHEDRGERATTAPSRAQQSPASNVRAIASHEDADPDDQEPEAPDDASEQVQMLWAVRDGPAVGGGPLLQSGPTLMLYPTGGQAPIRALLDSGAVRNYVGHDLATERKWKLTPCSTSAKLANGAVVKLNGTVDVPVRHSGREFSIRFFVLPGDGPKNGVDGSSCILGVRTMCQMRVSLCFDEQGDDRRVTVRTLNSSGSDASFPSLAAEGGLHYVELQEEDLPVTVIQEPDVLVLRCEYSMDELLYVESPEPSCQEGTARMDENWRPVRAAPEYSVRLRPLRADETKDCPEQTHTVEVRWSSSPLARPGLVHDYSQNLYAGLTVDQQQAYDQELERFQDRGWWEPIVGDGERRDTEVALPEAIAFPVVQGQKVRPCVDLRRGNAASPPSSYPGESCATILAQIRVAMAAISRKARDCGARGEPLTFATLDAATAFYRVRLHDRTAIIRSLGRRFAARRLVFGLRCGPAVLREALSALIGTAIARTAKGSAAITPLHWEYVDDISLLGPRNAVRDLQAEIIRLGASWGFEFSPHKSHSFDFMHDGRVSCFPDFCHLGVKFVFNGIKTSEHGSLVLRCVTGSDPSQQTFREGQKVTKRSLFRAAGAAFDPLCLHAERCLAADYVRRISGRWKVGWDQEVSVNNVEAKTLTIALSVLSGRAAECDHEVCFSADALEVACDSSPFGMGFSVYFSSDGRKVPLAKKARSFRGPMLNWHQNRKETYGLAAAHVFIDTLVPFLQELPLHFLSDSKTALSWLRGGSRLTCKSIERIAISRLCDAIADVREAWRRKHHIIPQLLHIPAELNAESDALSRLASAWGIPDEVIYEGRGVPNAACEAPLAGGEPLVPVLPSSLDSQRFSADEEYLRIVSESGALSQGPNGLQVGHGKPARARLIQIQWLSPLGSTILRALGGSPPPDIDMPSPSPAPGLGEELHCFSLAEDGLLMKEVQTGKVNGISSKRLCYYVPTDTAEGRDYAQSLVEAYHKESGCLNNRYIRWMTSRCFSIPGLRPLVDKICRSCEGCRLASNRRFYTTVDSARSLRSGVKECWSTVSADLAEMCWDRKRRFCAVLLMTCHFSGFCVVAPLRDQKSLTVASEMSRIFDLLGCPVLLRTDGGPCFRGKALRDFLETRAVQHRILSPYSPFSNGLAERAIASVKFLTRQLGDKRSWPSTLGKVVRRLNCKPFMDTDMSPFEIFFCRPLRLGPENSLVDDNPGGHAEPDNSGLRDEVTRLVQAAIDARAQQLSDSRGLRRRGPPPVGSEVVLFDPDTLERLVLRLVDAAVPAAQVSPDMFKETHYANVRPCNPPSGGH
ncbi:hypothetical protein FOL47_000598, partial [Perkinsus chesapeaki]